MLKLLYGTLQQKRQKYFYRIAHFASWKTCSLGKISPVGLFGFVIKIALIVFPWEIHKFSIEFGKEFTPNTYTVKKFWNSYAVSSHTKSVYWRTKLYLL